MWIYPASGIAADSIRKTTIECPLSDTRDTTEMQLSMPLMPGMCNETCTVQRTVTTDDGEGGQTTETKDITLSDDCPLCLAYILNRQGKRICSNGYHNTRRGSAFLLPTPTDGNDNTSQESTDSMFDLCAQGMMQTMNRSYAEALYAGAHEVTFAAMMTQRQIHTFDFCRTYIIDGVRYLPLQMQTQTGNRDLQEVTITMMKV